MTRHHRSGFGGAETRRATAGQRQMAIAPLSMPAPVRPGTAPLNRRYEMSWLGADGLIGSGSRVAPAIPAFEEAFAAFGRGTLIATGAGPVAVEDLLPGTLIETAENGLQPLLWTGSMTLSPRPDQAGGHSAGTEGGRLIRMPADTFGPERPGQDLILGPRARLLYRNTRCQQIIGREQAFAPARAFADGACVIEVTPLGPVQVFHLGFASQVAVRANGIEVESYHPGHHADTMMSPGMVPLFLSLFPHVSGLSGFGPMPVPRLTAFEMESLQAA